jgi:AraC-like DNA-binding protein
MKVLLSISLFLITLTSFAYPSQSNINKLIRQVDQGNTIKGFDLRQLYAACNGKKEIDSLHSTLTTFMSERPNSTLNQILYARRLEQYGFHSSAIKALSQVKSQLKLNSDETISEFYTVLSLIKLHTENPKSALKFNQLALHFAKKGKDKLLIQASYSNLGMTYNALGAHKKAIACFEKALELETEGPNRNTLYISLNKAISLYEIGKLNEAKKIFEQSYGQLELNHDTIGMIRTSINLSDIEFRRSSLDSAEELLFRAKKLANHAGYTMELIPILKKLSYCAEKKGNQTAALALLKDYDSLRTALNASDILSDEFAQLAETYLKEGEQHQRELQESKISSLKEQRIYLFMICFLITTFSFILFIKHTKLKKRSAILLAKQINEVKPRKADYAYDEKLIFELEEILLHNKGYMKKDLTLDSLAKQLATNRTYLSSSINTHYGLHFKKWINELRTKEAILLLTDPSQDIYSIESIADQVGFTSISSFNENFKRITGFTPSSFRSH